MKKIALLFLLITIEVFSQNKKNQILIPYRDKNLWGLCDTLGSVKVKPFAEEMMNFIINDDGNGKYVVKKNGKLMVIDQNKNILSKEEYYDSIKLSKYKDEIIVYKVGKAGLVKNNSLIIPVIYDKIYFAENNSYKVVQNQKNGIFNRKGELVIPVEYSYISGDWNNSSKNEYKWKASGKGKNDIFYDEKIEEIAREKKSFEANNFNESFSSINNYKDLETKLKNILQVKYDEIVRLNLYDKYAIVKKNNKYGVYSTSKNLEIILPQYDHIEYMGQEKMNPLFIVELNGNFGVVLDEKNIKLPLMYDKIYNYQGDNFIIEKSGKKGLFILNNYYPIINAKYKEIDSFEFIKGNKNKDFSYFGVKTMDGKKGFIGENGIEYFNN